MFLYNIHIKLQWKLVTMNNFCSQSFRNYWLKRKWELVPPFSHLSFIYWTLLLRIAKNVEEFHVIIHVIIYQWISFLHSPNFTRLGSCNKFYEKQFLQHLESHLESCLDSILVRVKKLEIKSKYNLQKLTFSVFY